MSHLDDFDADIPLDEYPNDEPLETLP